MGVDYFFFLEGKIEDRWVCLDNYMKSPDGEMVHRPLAAGRSIMRDLLEDIDCRSIDPKTLSPDVRRRVVGPDEEVTYGVSCFCFDPELIRIPKKRYEYERYVLREDMNRFENGDIDNIEYWLTEAEYAMLSEEEKREYTFFRWDDPWSAFALKRQLAEKIRDAVHYYNIKFLPYESRIEKTRIVVLVSY